MDAPVENPGSNGAPDGPQWLRDRDFLQRAGTELLVALGVPESLAGRTEEIRAAVEQLEALAGDRESGAAAPLSEQDRQTRNAAIDRLVLAGHPLAESVIDRLQAEGIRTEIVGVSGRGLRPALDALIALHRDGAWREMDEAALEGTVGRAVGSDTGLRAPRQKGGWGDAGRIAAVLSRMPKATLKRIAKVSNRFLLRIAVFGTLRMMHRAAQEGAISGGSAEAAAAP